MANCSSKTEAGSNKQGEGGSAAAADYQVTFVELGSVNCIPCKMMQPIMKEIEDYGKIIQEKTGYIPKLKDKISRVIIFVKDEKTWGWNKEKNKEQDKRLSQRPKSNFQTKKVLKGISLAVIAQ